MHTQGGEAIHEWRVEVLEEVDYVGVKVFTYASRFIVYNGFVV